MSIAVLIKESVLQNQPLHLVQKPDSFAYIGRLRQVDVKALVTEIAEMPVELAGSGLHAEVLAVLKNPPASWEALG